MSDRDTVLAWCETAERYGQKTVTIDVDRLRALLGSTGATMTLTVKPGGTTPSTFGMVEAIERAQADEREALGRLVREVWIEWAREQSDPKPSWLVPWEDLDEPDREVDRRIGERVAAYTVAALTERS